MKTLLGLVLLLLAGLARGGDSLDQRLPGDGLPVEDANEIALKAFAKPGSVEENRLHYRNRRWTYSIRISDLKGHFFRYEVDAISGKWRKIRSPSQGRSRNRVRK